MSSAAVETPRVAPPVVPRARTATEATFWGVSACFVLSGFAALVYETAWMRQCAVVFGTSELAVATVLATYMGGLALGALAAGRFLGRVKRPVLVYGLLELGIAVGALAVPLLLKLAQAVQAWLLGGQPHPPDAGAVSHWLFYLLATFAILMVPTGLMGATLPVLTQHVVRRRDQIGSRVGLLYALNTFGAVLGTLAAAFVLLPALGLLGTVLVGAAVNLAVFGIAATISRASAQAAAGEEAQQETVESATEADEPNTPARLRRARFAGLRHPAARPSTAAAERIVESVRWAELILPMILVSGAVAFTYEVLWTRLLGHILGGSIYAFATMLASFLTGITLGSAIASRLARDRTWALGGFIAAQLGAGVLSIGIYHLLEHVTDAAAWLSGGAGEGLLRNAAVAAMVLLPATLCIGATFPFAVRLVARHESEAGAASARVYAWNTAGAIAGAILAGFFIVPGMGFEGTIRLAVGLNLALAVAASLLLANGWLEMSLGMAALAGALMVWFQPAAPEKLLRTSPLHDEPAPGSVLYSSVGRSSTVMMLDMSGSLRLRTNGLPESVIARRGSPPVLGRDQLWLSALPVIARPQAESMLIIGYGGGVAVEGLPSTIKSADVVELEPEVIEANRKIGPLRAKNPLEDERVRIVINDARSALALTDKRYDIVVSQPSHPWTAGASHLYTREFITQVKEHLEPGGVLVQWMNFEFVRGELFKTLGATLLDVFENVRVYRNGNAMLMLLASDEPLEPERQLALSGEPLASSPDLYARLGVSGVLDVAAALVMDEGGMARLCAGAPINTDNFNRIAARSPGCVRREPEPDGLEKFFLPHDPLVRGDCEIYREPVGVKRAMLALRLAHLGYRFRAEEVARETPSLAERFLALGLLHAYQGDGGKAAQELLQAVQLAPDDADARFAAVNHYMRKLLGDQAPPAAEEALRRLDGPGAAVVQASMHARRGQWREVAAMDDRLAAIHPDELTYFGATGLRAAWRLELMTDENRQARGQEALEILDPALAKRSDLRQMLARVKAAEAADRPDCVLDTACIIVTQLASLAMNADEGQKKFLAETGPALYKHIQALRGDKRVEQERVRELTKAFKRKKPGAGEDASAAQAKADGKTADLGG